MNESSDKIVSFYYWCPKCVHRNKTGDEEPCSECLYFPVNQDSRKPVKFEEKEKGTKKEKKRSKK